MPAWLIHCLSALVALLSLHVLPAQGRDWFVAAGAPVGGDGSRAAPFADPWQALERCEAGDAIHLTAGRYTGKLQRGQWTIEFDRVRLFGGYSTDWSARDPWSHPSELVHDRASKNFTLEPRLLVRGKQVVLDGLVLDVREENEYVDAAATGRTPQSLASGRTTVQLEHPGTVRNCVLLNAGQAALDVPAGTTLENNLIVNTAVFAVRIRALPTAHPGATAPALVRGNTVLWSWCDRAPGTGRYSGSGLHVAGPAVIEGNLIGHCDNHGIDVPQREFDRITIRGNTFTRNLWANVRLGENAIDDRGMDLLEEAGLRAHDGNRVLDPQLPFAPAWLDMASRRTAGQPGKLVMDDWNRLRRALGLDLVGSEGVAPSGIAPAYPAAAAMQLLQPGNAAAAGARRRPLGVECSAAGAAGAAAAAGGAAKTYAPSDLATWARDPASVVGKALALTVALGGVANITGLPAEFPREQHEGAFLYDPTGKQRITGFYAKGSSVQRTIEQTKGRFQGAGTPERRFVVRGTAHAMNSVPKAGFHIESIAEFTAGVVAAERAVGRDWFVRAGAQGGDGSRQQPFRDPWQALERCERGDTIHVVGGDYFGKLKAGRWTIDCPDLTLLGGYDAEFTQRDPWRQPTRLLCPDEFKGRRGGCTIEGSGPHDGAVVDGFVFDKRGNNRYASNGDLVATESDTTEHIWLSRPRCVVRNCVFLNGAQGALRMANGQRIENNVFVNHHDRTIAVSPGHSTEPVVVRGNTILFTWDNLFGQGNGRGGSGIVLEGRVRAVLDGNIVQFADNDAIRLGAEPGDVELVDNVFAQNLFSVVYRPITTTWLDDAMFAQLGDLGWRRCSGNRLLAPAIPLDAAWFDSYLGRTAFVPGKVVMDDWNRLRELMGQPLLASGARPPEGFARAFPMAAALAAWPRNADCKAGARPVPLPVAFTGIERAPVAHGYEDVAWEVAADAAAWARFAGKRVRLQVVVQRADNQWLMAGVAEATHAAWVVAGPKGIDSGGLPLRVYTLLGTGADRWMRQAAATEGPSTWWVAGVAGAQRQLLVEAVERVD